MTKLSGTRTFTKADRFFEMAQYITVYLDMETCAVTAAKNLPVKINPAGGNFATIGSRLFPVDVRHHVFGPFKETFEKAREVYSFEFRPKPTEPKLITNYHSDVWGAVGTLFWNMSLVFFYEQYRPWLETTFGASPKDKNKWPEIFRFAWALRNAGAHHHGKLNITDPAIPAVRWHHLAYDHKDVGTIVHDGVMNMTDVLILMIEMSDELDRLNAPLH